MPRILLVDDSHLMRLASQHTLIRAGYEVRAAADGEEALRMAAEQLPDLILLDMLLPRMSGLDVLRALKQNPATAEIPVIVLSSLSQKNEEKLRAAGAAGYLEKAAAENHSERLIDAVGSTLEQHQRQKLRRY